MTTNLRFNFSKLIMTMTLLAGISYSAMATKYVVTTTSDSGSGSLREALTLANVVSDQDTIHFDIPGAGPHLITLLTALPSISQPLVINGYSQAGSAPNTNTDRAEATLKIGITGDALGFPGLVLGTGSSGSKIEGLWMYDFDSASIILEAGSDGNTLRGNFFGVNVDGTVLLGIGSGIEIYSANNTLGGQAEAYRSIVCGDVGGAAILISGVDAHDNTIQTCFIGLSSNGLTTIGGSDVGIRFANGAHDNLVGGENNLTPNHIAGCSGAGIEVLDSATSGINIFSNLITDNTGVAIDLNGDGQSPNDLGDGDVGPNGMINYPVILQAMTDGAGGMYAEVYYEGDPWADYRLDWYVSSTSHPSGHGELTTWAGRSWEQADAAGIFQEHFTFGLSQNYPAGSIITCTITNLTTGNTSECAQNFTSIFGKLEVTNTSDVVNGDTTSIIGLIMAPGGDGISLREAIHAANNNNTNWGTDHIFFDIPGTPPHIIQPTFALPALNSSMYINGGSEPDFSVGSPSVQIDGTLAGADAIGLEIISNYVFVHQLALVNFSSDGIRTSKNHGQFLELFIGVLPDGLTAAGNGGYGLHLIDAEDWTINEGGIGPMVLSNNTLGGIRMAGGDCQNIRVSNCLIGPTYDGTSSSPGQAYGIKIQDGAHHNSIGSNSVDDRNVISGNNLAGIFVKDFATYENRIEKNYIGTDLTGLIDLGNLDKGIYILNSNSNEIIDNVVSGNDDHGILLTFPGATDNVVQGNLIGLGTDGVTKVQNSASGIVISEGSSSNLIGGNDASKRNVISGNQDYGIIVKDEDSDLNTIQGNYIGLGADGVVEKPNLRSGIALFSGPNETNIGGSLPGEGNVISANGYEGIYLDGAGTEGTVIDGNIIGLDHTGDLRKGNGGSGIEIDDITSLSVGLGAANFISDNYYGVDVYNSSGIHIAGNYIGTDITGLKNKGNRYQGIFLGTCTLKNVIGFDDSITNAGSINQRNVISGNGSDGIRLTNSSNQVVSGNYIGTNAPGLLPIANGNYGILMFGSCSSNLFGTDSDGNFDALETNVISGNGTGIRISGGAAGTNNRVSGNFIGTDYTGNGPLGNGGLGLLLAEGFSGTIIGTDGNGNNDDIEGNVISSNGTVGIRMSAAEDYIIAGNNIGVGADNSTALGNHYENFFVTYESVDNVIGYDPASMTNSDAKEVGNKVWHSDRTGISVVALSARNRISRNSFQNNAALAIDLDNDGVTSNDDGDIDTGDNELLNFPVLDELVLSSNMLSVSGFAYPNSTIEFYLADDGVTPAGHSFAENFGEGKTFLFAVDESSVRDVDGTVDTYTDDGKGPGITRTQNRFEFGIDASQMGLQGGNRVTALVIDPTNNTSEFSAVKAIVGIEDCSNGLDDDGDGLVDCDDPDCLLFDGDADGGCIYTDLDDDNDGILDVDELDCTLTGVPEKLGWFTYTPNPVATAQLPLAATVLPATSGPGLTSTITADAYYIDGVDQTTLSAAIIDGDYMQFGFTTPAYTGAFLIDDIEVLRFKQVDGAVDENLGYAMGLHYSTDGFTTSTFLSGAFVPEMAPVSADSVDSFTPLTTDLVFAPSTTYEFRVYVYSKVTPTIAAVIDGFTIYSHPCAIYDTDSDGVSNSLDVDSDNDGLFDALESGSAQPHTNGVLDGLVNDLGIPISVSDGASGINYSYWDTDSNSLMNAYDPDSDGDGCPDVLEAGFPDADGDGQLGGLVPPTVDSTGKVTSGGD